MANIPTDFRRRSAGPVRISNVNPYQGLLTATEQMGRAKSQGMATLRTQQQRLQQTERQALGSMQDAQTQGGMASIRAAQQMGRAELAAARTMAGAQMDSYEANRAALSGLTDGVVKGASALEEIRQKNEVVRFESEQLSFDNFVARRRVELDQQLQGLETNFSNERTHWEQVEAAVSNFRTDLADWRAENTTGQFAEEFALAEEQLVNEIEVQAATRVPAIQRTKAANEYTVMFNNLLSAGDYQQAWSLARRKLPNISPEPGAAEVQMQEARNLIIESAISDAGEAAEQTLLNPEMDARQSVQQAKEIWGKTYANLREMFPDAADSQALSPEEETRRYNQIGRASSDAIISGFLEQPDLPTLNRLAEKGFDREAVMSELDLRYTPSKEQWPGLRADLSRAFQRQQDDLLRTAEETVDLYIEGEIGPEVFSMQMDRASQLNLMTVERMVDGEIREMSLIEVMRNEALLEAQEADNEEMLEQGLELAEQDEQYNQFFDTASGLLISTTVGKKPKGWATPRVGPGQNRSQMAILTYEDLQNLYPELMARGYGARANVELTRMMLRLERRRITGGDSWLQSRKWRDIPEARTATNMFFNGVRQVIDENPAVNWTTFQGAEGGLYGLVQRYNQRMEERFGQMYDAMQEMPEDQRRAWLSRNIEDMVKQFENDAIVEQVRGMSSAR